MTDSPWIAALFALFLWWFSTGAILFVVKSSDQNARGAHLRSVMFAVPFLIFGVVAVTMSIQMDSVGGAYLGFVGALALWGWIELTFLAGVITGPNRSFCPDDIPEWERFVRSWGTIAYHEMLLASALVVLLTLAWDAPNQVALWTFAVLFLARISAKLNLYFGVPKINTEFLPTTLVHLPSHFRIARLNWVFPVSVTALTGAVTWWLIRLSETGEVGFALLAALTALALLEHWLMVLPLPDERLWRWMIPAPKTNEHIGLREDPNGL